MFELLGSESFLAEVERWLAGISGQKISDLSLKIPISSLCRLKDTRAKLINFIKSFNFRPSSLPSSRSVHHVDTSSASSSIKLAGSLGGRKSSAK